jgi:hypothetical protein
MVMRRIPSYMPQANMHKHEIYALGQITAGFNLAQQTKESPNMKRAPATKG